MNTRYAHLPLSGSVTVLLGSACVLALLLQNVAGGPPTPLSRFILVALAIAVLLAIDVYMHHRVFGLSCALRVGSLIFHFVLVEALTLLDGFTYTAILYLTLPFPVFFRLGQQSGFAVSTGLFVWFTIKYAALKTGWMADPFATNTYLFFVISLILITAMAQVVLRERASRKRVEKLFSDLEVSHQQLKAYADQVAALAAAEERNRVARDIHDSLGHALTVIGVQLEKALIVHSDSPAETLRAVTAAKRLADRALTEVRQSLAALRHDTPPFHFRDALKALLHNTDGLPFTVEIIVEGDETRYTTQQLMILYRAAQEGLTNVQKHASARCVTVRLNLGTTEATLTLHDDGIGVQGDAVHTNGFGLRGLRERLEAVGGELFIHAASSGGTELHVVVPQRHLMTGHG